METKALRTISDGKASGQQMMGGKYFQHNSSRHRGRRQVVREGEHQLDHNINIRVTTPTLPLKLVNRDHKHEAWSGEIRTDLFQEL